MNGGKTVIWQTVLPRSMRESFTSQAHGGITGGHLAKRRTAATIQARAIGHLGPPILICISSSVLLVLGIIVAQHQGMWPCKHL